MKPPAPLENPDSFCFANSVLVALCSIREVVRPAREDAVGAQVGKLFDDMEEAEEAVGIEELLGVLSQYGYKRDVQGDPQRFFYFLCEHIGKDAFLGEIAGESEFISLVLQRRGNSSLQEALREHIGNGQLSRFPKVLCLNVNSFVFNRKRRCLEKIDDEFACPEEFMLQGRAYRMTAVIEHEGDYEDGHYTCYARWKGQWLFYDDDEVEELELLIESPSLLFYTLEN